MRRRYGHINLTKAFQVKGFTPPQRIVDIAEERTIGLQCTFVHFGGLAQDIGAFAQSCYMQGVNDSIDALTQNCKPLELKSEVIAVREDGK